MKRMLSLSLLLSSIFLCSPAILLGEDPGSPSVKKPPLKIVFVEGKIAGCADLAAAGNPAQLKLGKTLIEESEIMEVSEDLKRITLSESATKRLFTNIDRMNTEIETEPAGGFFDPKDAAIVLLAGGKPILAGLLSNSIERLSSPGDCPALVPDSPTIAAGKMRVILVVPKTRAELGEDFEKVLFEEGPDAAFKPALSAKMLE